jgi:hypothetical protein
MNTTESIVNREVRMDARNEGQLYSSNWQFQFVQDDRITDRGRSARAEIKENNLDSAPIHFSVPFHDTNAAIAYYKYICGVLKEFPTEGKEHVLETLKEFGLTGEYDQSATEISAVTQLYLSHTGRLAH